MVKGVGLKIRVCEFDSCSFCFLFYLIKRILRIPSKIHKDKNNINILQTTNSRVIWNLISLFNLKFKGQKSLEFKLWAKIKYYKDNKNSDKVEKFVPLFKKISSRNS